MDTYFGKMNQGNKPFELSMGKITPTNTSLMARIDDQVTGMQRIKRREAFHTKIRKDNRAAEECTRTHINDPFKQIVATTQTTTGAGSRELTQHSKYFDSPATGVMLEQTTTSLVSRMEQNVVDLQIESGMKWNEFYAQLYSKNTRRRKEEIQVNTMLPQTPPEKTSGYGIRMRTQLKSRFPAATESVQNSTDNLIGRVDEQAAADSLLDDESRWQQFLVHLPRNKMVSNEGMRLNPYSFFQSRHEKLEDINRVLLKGILCPAEEDDAADPKKKRMTSALVAASNYRTQLPRRPTGTLQKLHERESSLRTPLPKTLTEADIPPHDDVKQFEWSACSSSDSQSPETLDESCSISSRLSTASLTGMWGALSSLKCSLANEISSNGPDDTTLYCGDHSGRATSFRHRSSSDDKVLIASTTPLPASVKKVKGVDNMVSSSQEETEAKHSYLQEEDGWISLGSSSFPLIRREDIHQEAYIPFVTRLLSLVGKEQVTTKQKSDVENLSGRELKLLVSVSTNLVTIHRRRLGALKKLKQRHTNSLVAFGGEQDEDEQELDGRNLKGQDLELLLSVSRNLGTPAAI